MEKIKPDLEKLEAALDADDTLSDAEKCEIYNEALAELQEYQKWEEEEYEAGMRAAEEELNEIEGHYDEEE